MNGDGLCCAVMEVRTGKLTSNGMPSTFLFRQVLEEASTVAEALEILESAKKVAANNLILLDRQGSAAVAEIGPGVFHVRRSEKGMVFATNHHRTGKRTPPKCGRYAKLEAFAEKQAGTIDVAALQGALRNVNQGLITIQSMIFEPDALRLHLAIGKIPSARGQYKTLELVKLLE
jgi:hypothetical protein